MNAEELKIQCSGRWLEIFYSLGIEVRSDGKHSACPACGSGRNAHRFRMDNKDGTGSWICTQCGAGTGLSLVHKCLGLSYPETIKRVAEIVGACKMDDVKSEKPKYDKKKMLNEIWTSSKALLGSDPVLKYLHGRGLVLIPDNVRFCPECYESSTKTNLPAMVARVISSNGKPIALHRTYLDPDMPEKAKIESPKKSTPALESLVGSAVRLFPPKGNVVGVAEGIETAIACSQIFDGPVWACLSTSIMEGFEPPEGIRKIVIFGDNDANYSGAKSAYRLANKLYLKDYLVEVKLPDKAGQDWNDVLLEK